MASHKNTRLSPVSSAAKVRSIAFRTLAAAVFLNSILASFSNCLAKDYSEVIAVQASSGRLLWRYKRQRFSAGALPDRQPLRSGMNTAIEFARPDQMTLPEQDESPQSKG